MALCLRYHPDTLRIIAAITDNDGVGLLVADDGSMAEIDSWNLVFHNNAAGDIIGDVTDVAP